MMYAHIIVQDKKPGSMISLFVSLEDLICLILLCFLFFLQVCLGHYVLITNDTKINFIVPQTAAIVSLHKRFTVDLWTEICLNPGRVLSPHQKI